MGWRLLSRGRGSALVPRGRAGTSRIITGTAVPAKVWTWGWTWGEVRFGEADAGRGGGAGWDVRRQEGVTRALGKLHGESRPWEESGHRAEFWAQG